MFCLKITFLLNIEILITVTRLIRDVAWIYISVENKENVYFVWWVSSKESASVFSKLRLSSKEYRSSEYISMHCFMFPHRLHFPERILITSSLVILPYCLKCTLVITVVNSYVASNETWDCMKGSIQSKKNIKTEILFVPFSFMI